HLRRRQRGASRERGTTGAAPHGDARGARRGAAVSANHGDAPARRAPADADRAAGGGLVPAEPSHETPGAARIGAEGADDSRVGATTDEELVATEQLAAYLADLPALRDALPLRAVERVGHGQSNLTYRVVLTEGDVILRRPPPGPLPPSA